MQKRLLSGFVLGLSVGALYHYANKATPVEQDGLYKLVSRLRGKVVEARDPNTELHATLDKAATKAKGVAQNAGQEAADRVKDAAATAGSKVKGAARTPKAKAKAEQDAIDPSI